MTRVESMTKQFATEVAYHSARIKRWNIFAEATPSAEEKRFARQLVAISENHLKDAHRRAKNKLTINAVSMYLDRVRALDPDALIYLN